MAENSECSLSENSTVVSQNNSLENEPKKEDNNNSSNSEPKSIFAGEKNIKRVLEIKNKETSKKNKK